MKLELVSKIVVIIQLHELIGTTNMKSIYKHCDMRLCGLEKGVCVFNNQNNNDDKKNHSICIIFQWQHCELSQWYSTFGHDWQSSLDSDTMLHIPKYVYF